MFRLNGVYWVCRAEDVEAVLADGATFPTPFGPEMAELSGGHAAPPTTGPIDRGDEVNFSLGMDGPDQARQNAIIRSVVLPGDTERVGRYARAFALSLIAGGKGRLDVVGDLSIRIPTEICRRYFGLGIADPDSFAEWAMSVSALVFADPYGDPTTREVALAGAQRLRRIIDIAIARARRPVARAVALGTPDLAQLTLVERLVALSQHDRALELQDDEIRAILLGMVVGFVPTNGVGGAKMIEEILRRPEVFDLACKVARAGKVERLEAILLEAARLNPGLAPGQWRYCPGGATVAGREIPAGATVMVATMSAMRDRRRWAHPGRFDPNRGQEPGLIFGDGLHECVGKYLAMRIIREALLPLFALPGLRVAAGPRGRMQRVGYFTKRLDMVYDGPASTQSQIIIAIPVVDTGKVTDIREALRDMGNPASSKVTAALDATGIVHFSSCSLINAGVPGAPEFRLLIELNVDGQRDAAIHCYAVAMGRWIRPIVALALGDAPDSLEAALRRHALDLHFWPWGSTGLHFPGTGEFSVADIHRQQALHAHVCDKIAANLAGDADKLGGRALQVLANVRHEIRDAAWANPEDGGLLELDAMLVAPTRGGLSFARRRPDHGFWAPFADVWSGGLNHKVGTVAFATWVVTLLLCHHALRQGAWLSLPALGHSIWGLGAALYHGALGDALAAGLRGGLLALLALVLTILFWTLVLAALAWFYRRAERLEVPDDEAPDREHLREIAAREDSPGHAQNHIIAVTPLKRGLMRRLSLALALWGIRQSLLWFRTGFVVTMGTIHYARWFRVPGTHTLVFQSNYDGSWESYLEDFITRAHQGQTAAWSNGVGFPNSEWLINKGARDGDRFKRWVRRQQVPTDFWYSRYPQLTTQEIRRNALVQDGLARAYSDTAARAWLDLIGSAPRQEYELESEEIQSILFRGLKRAYFSACIPVRLPSDGRKSDWLMHVREHLSFGAYPKLDGALYLALSPTGIARFDSPQGDAALGVDMLRDFPSAFAGGMSARSKILRDPDPEAHGWRWRDAAPEPEANVADAVLLIYAPNCAALDQEISNHCAALEEHGGAVVHGVIRTLLLDEEGTVIDGTPRGRNAPKAVSHEHFGFRDGISQPVIRGTEQFTPGFDRHDLVEPGEFVLGYRNNQGYFPPAITVPAATDLGESLPILAQSTAFGHPDFAGRDDLLATRDFGRNGSFLVIRQLGQDVAGFRRFADGKAGELVAHYGEKELRATVGEHVDGDWVAAKMMGRWRDGRPLIGNPRRANEFNDQKPNNDFLYGRDDPRGHQCPLGAHIRRTNPRDSLEPDDPLEQTISNRHRMLRRGRSYVFDPAISDYVSEHAPEADVQRGMLFMCLCGDLERQFEFVQQSWATLPSFHGLTGEPDPITTDARLCEPRGYSIPTAAGPLALKEMQTFVEFHGGGYFFVPSRSAIDYLINLDGPRFNETRRWKDVLQALGASQADAGST
ncbi:cytochrome P450 [Sphingomonas naasensis]|uniref:cytochrome P450 n=1 Tax=Sphingomonas naasensis TaxID=1344951 RepID=UPI00141B01A3